jgi:hypothetical protein
MAASPPGAADGAAADGGWPPPYGQAAAGGREKAPATVAVGASSLGAVLKNGPCPRAKVEAIDVPHKCPRSATDW